MIDNIKGDIKRHLNLEVKIVSKENRNKNDVFFGIITEIYSHVFVVSNGNESRSFTYSDILSNDITISFL